MGFTNQVLESIARTTPRVLLALLILIVGWIGARILSKALFLLLARTSLEEWSSRKLGVRTGGKYGHRVERIVARTVYYALLIVLLVVVLNVLDLETINRPLINLVDQILLALPKVLLAILIVLVAFIVGKIASFGLTRGLKAARFDERLGRFGGVVAGEKLNLAKGVGELAFWFIMVIGVIQGLSALDMDIFVEPLQGALNELGEILPNLVGGALILLVGYLLAVLAGRLVTNLLAGIGFDALVYRIGLLTPPQPVSPEDSTTAQAIPETERESDADQAPKSRDAAPGPQEQTAFQAEKPDSQTQERHEGERPGHEAVAEGSRLPRTPSRVVGLAVVVVLVLLVLTQVLSIVHLDHLAGFLPVFILLLGKIGLALVVLGAGVWAGNWTKARVDTHYSAQKDGPLRFLGTGIRVAVILFASAMALQQLGVAPSLIVTAFGILFGAICLALALAFGLGGKEVAGDLLQKEYGKRTPEPVGRSGRPGKKKTTEQTDDQA